MKLLRSQALVLSNVLFHYMTLDQAVRSVDLSRVLSDLSEFLSSETTEEQYVDVEEDDDDCEVDSDSDEDESDDDEDEDEETEALVADGEVSATVLHKLSLQRAMPLSTSMSSDFEDAPVELSFEAVLADDDDIIYDVDLLVNEGEAIISNVRYVKRTGTELAVYESGIGWHSFSVTKFDKQWTKNLPVNKVLEIK